MIVSQFEVDDARESVGDEEPYAGYYGYVAVMRVQDMSWTARIDNKVIASAGLVPLWPGVAEAWMIPGADTGRHAIAVGRELRRRLGSVMRDRGLNRVQANIHHEFERATRLAEWLGFKNEGLMRRFGVEGADYFRYARCL